MKMKFMSPLFALALLGFSLQAVATPTPPTLTHSVNGLTVTASWTAVPGATNYKLSYAPIPYTGPESIASLEVGNLTSFSATLWEGASFYIAVQAGDDEGFSEYSNIDSFTLAAASANLTGSWSIIETLGPNNCEESPGTQSSYIATIDQSGKSITAVFPNGLASGNLVGNTLTLTGTLEEDGGITSSLLNLTVMSGNTSFSGSSSWSWSDGDFSCSGTSSISGTKS